MAGKKRPRGRPPALNWPERIDASPEEIARAVLRMPHKKEWRFMQKGDSAMAFWVNQDNPTSKAIVHRDDASCEVPRSKQESGGKWHGPYDSKEEALSVAEEIKLNIISECSVCNP